MFIVNVPMIAITGGPCGGKSTWLAKIQQWLMQLGYRAIVLPETATELMSAGLGPAVIGNIAFQELLFRYSIYRENMYLSGARELQKSGPTVLICDRGVLDCFAYMGEDEYHAMLARFKVDHAQMRDRYQMVIHLVTAANGAEAFYTRANNSARSETAELARKLDLRTQAAWMDHRHYAIIDNSTDFDTKMRRAVAALARILHMPAPLEIERKFLIKNFDPSQLPPETVVVHIEQDYLTSNNAQIERRVRKWVAARGGKPNYYYAEKHETGKLGTRAEPERIITLAEYERYLKNERDPGATRIVKTRYLFPYSGKRFEADAYQEGGQDLQGDAVLEVELSAIDEPLELPPWMKLVEVTHDLRYRNASLAKASALRA